MENTFLVLNDFSSFLEIYVGLILAFTGLSQFERFISDKISSQLESSRKSTRELIDTSSFEQIETLNPRLITSPKNKKLFEWLKSMTDPNNKDILKQILDFKFKRAKVLNAYIALYGLIVLFSLGFSLNTREIHLGYFLTSLDEITALSTSIFSILSLGIIVAIMFFNPFINYFQASITNIYLKNFFITFISLLASIILALIYLINFGLTESQSSLSKGIACYLPLVFLVVLYPSLIVLNFAFYTLKVHHKLRLAGYKFVTNESKKPSLNLSPRILKNGKFNVFQFIIDFFNGLFVMISYNWFPLRPNYLTSFYTRFKSQSVLLMCSILVFGLMVYIFNDNRKSEERVILDLVKVSNKKCFEMLETCKTRSIEEIEEELSEYYAPNCKTFQETLELTKEIKKKPLTLSLKSEHKILDTKIVNKNDMLDTIIVNTKERIFLAFHDNERSQTIRYSNFDQIDLQYMIVRRDRRRWHILDRNISYVPDTIHIEIEHPL